MSLYKLRCKNNGLYMTDNSFKFFLNTKENMYVDDNAFNYDLKLNDIEQKYRSIFDRYNTNGDDTLDANELANLKNNLDEVNLEDEDRLNFTNKEARHFLKKFCPDLHINRKMLYGFLNSLQRNYMNTIETISDGIIDWTCQGEEGDCWLHSEVRALSTTEWGAQAIKDSISEDKEKRVYTITLKGVNFSCQITYNELASERRRNNRGCGDVDMILLEIATEKYFRQEVEAGRMDRNIDDLLCEGACVGKETMVYLLTGNVGHSFTFQDRHFTEEELIAKNEKIRKDSRMWAHCQENWSNYSNLYGRDSQEQFIRLIADKTNDYAIECNFKGSEDWCNPELYNINEEEPDEFNNMPEHAYVIEDIVMDSSGNIYDVILSNPHEPNVLIHKSLEEFLDQIAEVSVFDKNDNYDKLVSIAEPSWIRL